MRKNIFHDASVKLTISYLLIIMFLSLIFSFSLYNVSSSELERSISRQPGPVGQLMRSNNANLIEELLQEQDDAIDAARARLRNNLFLINILILITGGMLSYLLARRTLEPIEESHEAQNRFTADASHELRTPITAMRAETELTLTEPKLTLKNAVKQLESNMEELDKLTELSDGLLKLARLENNGLQKSSEHIDKLIMVAVNRVKPLAEKKKQLITVSKLPNSLVKVNKSSVIESLITILDNAVKYSPQKSIITIDSAQHKNAVSVNISDVGMGIKATDLPHIFDRFYRADQSRTESHVNGYGIGLSIAKAAIEVNGGDIAVQSVPEAGSTFTITLPTA